MFFRKQLWVLTVEFKQLRISETLVETDNDSVGYEKESFSVFNWSVYSTSNKSSFKKSWVIDFRVNYSYVFAPFCKLFTLFDNQILFVLCCSVIRHKLYFCLFWRYRDLNLILILFHHMLQLILLNLTLLKNMIV